MVKLEEDEILKEFFNTAEKKAKWLIRIKYIYILWIIFIILGLFFILIYYLII
jgi:hypothetical protein